MDTLKNGDPCEGSHDMMHWYPYTHYIGVDADRCYHMSSVGMSDAFIYARPIQPKETRPMTRCEKIAWACKVTMELATNPDADVWVVYSCNSIDVPQKDAQGYIPLGVSYSSGLRWWRSRLDRETGMPVKWERMEKEVE